jgi:4-hydroxy-3-methylbut-2-en-1-yl diphosphate synthase IspG/GcpE
MTVTIFFHEEEERGYYFGIEHTAEEVKEMREGGATIVRLECKSKKELNSIPSVF